jgi:hypothetical protein
MLKKILLCLTVAMSGLLSPISASAAECSMYEQSHPNFILDGSHLSTGKCSTCASCHKSGVFIGTPKNCVACHNGDPLRTTVSRSANHIPTVLLECNNCHNTTSFTTTWSMNHSVVNNIACSTCHSGTYASVYNAMAKPTNHVVTTAECGACHMTPANGSSFPVTAWDTVSHDSIHAGVTTGCVNCHNNVIAKGKAWYSAHPVTSDQCETCHSTAAAFKCATAVDKLINYAQIYIHRVAVAVRTAMA